jgi:ElaB/YqjD/DUF883 family membrane-anchored ribosome-binding protein
MTIHHDPSVEELRHESERSRAALTSTVAELREKVSDTADDLKTRLSPAHIKEEVKDYVREGGEQFFHSIERKARENPLQAIAIGAGLAYPLLGLLRAIPVPLMLVGAGLWLSRQPAGSGGNGLAADVAAKAADLGAEGAARIAESARSTADAVSAKAGAVTDRVRAAAHDLRDSVTETAQSVLDSVKEKAAALTDSATATASDAGTKASEMGEQSRNAFMDMVDRNPLAVAGVGLAIGGFIAACLPASEAENRMFGERSDDLKNKALDAAAQGVEHAKDVAAGMVGDVAAAAARQGLSAEGVDNAVKELTGSVKSVVDRGLDTALGVETVPASPNSSQSNASPNSTQSNASPNSTQSNKS